MYLLELKGSQVTPFNVLLSGQGGLHISIRQVPVPLMEGKGSTALSSRLLSQQLISSLLLHLNHDW